MLFFSLIWANIKWQQQQQQQSKQIIEFHGFPFRQKYITYKNISPVTVDWY